MPNEKSGAHLKWQELFMVTCIDCQTQPTPLDKVHLFLPHSKLLPKPSLSSLLSYFSNWKIVRDGGGEGFPGHWRRKYARTHKLTKWKASIDRGSIIHLWNFKKNGSFQHRFALILNVGQVKDKFKMFFSKTWIKWPASDFSSAVMWCLSLMMVLPQLMMSRSLG